MKTYKITVNKRVYWTEADNLSQVLYKASEIVANIEAKECNIEEFTQSEWRWKDAGNLFKSLPANSGIGLIFSLLLSITALGDQAINPNLPWTTAKSQYDNTKCYTTNKHGKLRETPCKIKPGCSILKEKNDRRPTC